MVKVKEEEGKDRVVNVPGVPFYSLSVIDCLL